MASKKLSQKKTIEMMPKISPAVALPLPVLGNGYCVYGGGYGYGPPA